MATAVEETSASSSFSAWIWLALYFMCNLSLTIYNKAVMYFIGFQFPWALTAIHTLCSAVGCYMAAYVFRAFRPSTLGSGENIIMLTFSVLYTVNIAVSNISLNMVSVPFHQVVRATTPVFTILLSVIFLEKSFSTLIYLSLVPVVMGVAMATMGEYNYTMYGFMWTLFGTLLAALKTIVTNRVQVGKLKLHPIDLLLRMSPLAFLQCMLISYTSGELDLVVDWVQMHANYLSIFALIANGVLAFMLNVVSFTANKKTSALTMTVAANIKQVLSIVLAVFIFDLTITYLNALGIMVTLAGGACYTQV